MNVQHSSRTDEWYTPLDILTRVQATLGQIDFDPASSAVANIRVGAKYFYTREMDALKEEWPVAGTIFCNPPGGKRGNVSNTVAFWQKFVAASHHPHFQAGIFLAFSLEALQTTQQCSESILEHTICVPKKRIAFDRPDGTRGSAPSHSNVICLVSKDYSYKSAFFKNFHSLGAVNGDFT